MTTQLPLRKVRMDQAVQRMSAGPDTDPLPPGDWFVQQRPALVEVFRDAEGTQHVADVALVDFLDGLATRQIVFVSWG